MHVLDFADSCPARTIGEFLVAAVCADGVGRA